MKRIHISQDYYSPLIQNLVFDLEDFHDYELVSKDQAEILMLVLNDVLPECNPKTVIVYDWFHCMPANQLWFDKVQQTYPNSNIKFITSIPHQNINVKSYFYDLLFNRTKAYYSQFPFSVLQKKTDHPWYYSGQESYKVNLNLQQTLPGDCAEKIFVFCARIRQKNSTRHHIANHLDAYKNLGYYYVDDLVNNSMPSDEGLLSGMDDPLVNGNYKFDIHNSTIQKIVDDSPSFFKGNSYYRGYAPVHVNYYSQSLISFVSESLDKDIVTLTEKTFDPMIHGHLVMPFGKNGLVQYMREQGWRVANFINYDYDQIQNSNQRLNAYLKEVDRLLEIDLEDWKDLYKQNLDVVRYNQRKFWFDTFYRMTHLFDKV
jgi:hypothetical protein